MAVDITLISRQQWSTRRSHRAHCIPIEYHVGTVQKLKRVWIFSLVSRVFFFDQWQIVDKVFTSHVRWLVRNSKMWFYDIRVKIVCRFPRVLEKTTEKCQKNIPAPLKLNTVFFIHHNSWFGYQWNAPRYIILL